MAARIKNMTEGRPAFLILSFALPLTIGNIFQQLYTVVDTMVVGKILGVEALAALGAADWMNWMMLGIIQGFTQGFGILMAQNFGAGRPEELRRTIGSSAVLSLLSALALLGMGQALADPVLGLLQTPAQIRGNALLYLRIMYLGIPIVMAYNLLSVILRSLGDSRTPLYAMILASLVNVVLDLLFVSCLGLGIAGAASATLIAQAVSSSFCLYHIRRLRIATIARSDLFLQGTLSFRLLFLGFPMAFQNAIIAIGGMIVQFVVNGFGVIFVAGFTATNKLYGVLEVAAISYGYAMTTYAGQNLGARRIDRIRKGMCAAVLIALATSALISIFMLTAGRSILSGFISSSSEGAEQALQIAYYYLSIMSICLPILYILHVSRSTIQGMGNTLLPMASGIVEFLMRTLSAIFMPMAIGSSGIFYAEVMAWSGATILLVASYLLIIRRAGQLFIP